MTMLPAGAERGKNHDCPGTEHEVDMFTKNLDDPAFKQYSKLFLGKWALGKDSE